MSDVLTRFHKPDALDSVTVERVQDVEDILDHNKSLRSQTQRSDWGRHVASIPNVILERWLNEEWMRGNTGVQFLSKEMDAIVAKKLKDPDWAWLRTDTQANQFRTGWAG